MKPQCYDAMTSSERRELREKYIVIQKGKCWYCRGPLVEKSKHEGKPVNWHRFPPNFLKYPIHLHHDHDTGLTIGAVHAYCNAVSFDYDESPLRPSAKSAVVEKKEGNYEGA